MRAGLLTEIDNIGCDIYVEGNNLKVSYRRSGIPPETVYPLIDELRKHKAEVIDLLKANATKPSPLWSNPHQEGTREARLASLEMLMDAILLTGIDRIRKSVTSFTRTVAFSQAEANIIAIRQSVFAGRVRVLEYQQAVDQWVRAAKEPQKPEKIPSPNIIQKHPIICTLH